MPPPCPNCDGTEVVSNTTRGETVCAECGTVLEETLMVEAVSFGSDSQLVGQYVSFGASSSGSSRGLENRELALLRGRCNIQKISEVLKLPAPHQESAQRIYMLCVQRGFTIGRLGMHVAAACLYCICRRQKTPHMLIDFSDALRVPVRTIGRIFVKMIRLLHINVPEVDPSLFMERYADRLPLGDKRQTVAHTAVRLIQAMTRDWIATGRRPSGLCGAALLISARLLGFKIRPEELVPVVRISSFTIQKRLREFSCTSTAALTAAEFESVDLQTLPILSGPPCFEAHRRKNAKLKIRENFRPNDDTGNDGLSSGEDDDVTGEAGKVGTSVPIIAPVNVDILEGFFDGTEGLDTEMLCSENPTTTEIVSIATDIASVLKRTADKNKRTDDVEPGASEATTTAEVSTSGSVNGGTPSCGANTENDVCTGDNTAGTPFEDNENTSLEMLLNEVCERQDELLFELRGPLGKTGSPFGDIFDTQSTVASQSDLTGTNGTGRSALGYGTGAERVYTGDNNGDAAGRTCGENNEDMIETLSDVSDSEISDFLLSEKEKKSKTLIWDEMTKGFIGAVHRRFRDRKRRTSHHHVELPFKVSTLPKRRKRPELPEAASAAESVKLAFSRSAVGASKLIDDDVLDSLFS